MAGPPQAARSSERPALLSAGEEPLYMEMSLRRWGPRRAEPAGLFTNSRTNHPRADLMETWPGPLHNSTQTSPNASERLLTPPGYKLHVPGRVSPRPDINRLSGLLMIYTRLCCAAGGGRRGWENASFSWAAAAALALCGLLVNWLWVEVVSADHIIITDLKSYWLLLSKIIISHSLFQPDKTWSRVFPPKPRHHKYCASEANKCSLVFYSK